MGTRDHAVGAARGLAILSRAAALAISRLYLSSTLFRVCGSALYAVLAICSTRSPAGDGSFHSGCAHRSPSRAHSKPPDAAVSSRLEKLPADTQALIFELVCAPAQRLVGERVAASRLPQLSRALYDPALRGVYASIRLNMVCSWTPLAATLRQRPDRAALIRHLEVVTDDVYLGAMYAAMGEVFHRARESLQSCSLILHRRDRVRAFPVVVPELAASVNLRRFNLVVMPDDLEPLPVFARDVVRILDAVVGRVESLAVMLGCVTVEEMEAQTREVPRLTARPSRLQRLHTDGCWPMLVADLTRAPCSLLAYRGDEHVFSRSVQQRVYDAVHPATAAQLRAIERFCGLSLARFTALETVSLVGAMGASPGLSRLAKAVGTLACGHLRRIDVAGLGQDELDEFVEVIAGFGDGSAPKLEDVFIGITLRGGERATFLDRVRVALGARRGLQVHVCSSDSQGLFGDRIERMDIITVDGIATSTTTTSWRSLPLSP